jgi:general secretion pathway protein A
MLTTVCSELRLLSSKDFDSRSLLCIVFAGDSRLPERLRQQDLLPLGSRIRRRLVLDFAGRDELLSCLDHLLDAAGNSSLLTTELKAALAEHAAGNYRVMMNLGDELLAHAFEREVPQLDEKLFFDVFAAPSPKKKTNGGRRR